MQLSDRTIKCYLELQGDRGDRVTIKHRQNSYRITVINLIVNWAEESTSEEICQAKICQM